MQGGFQSLWTRDIGGPEMLYKKLFNHPTAIYVISSTYTKIIWNHVIFIKSNKDLQKSELSSVLAIIS